MTEAEKIDIHQIAAEIADEYALIYGKRCSTENALRMARRVLAGLPPFPPDTIKLACGHIADGKTWP
jgi:hypothetical protein